MATVTTRSAAKKATPIKGKAPPIKGKAAAGEAADANTFDKDQDSYNAHTTWPSKDPSEWTFSQWFFASLGVLPNFRVEKPAPVRKLGDPVPVWTMTDQFLTMLPWVAVPIGLHYGLMRFAGITLHPVAAYLLYTTAYNLMTIFVVRKVNGFGHKYGFFAGHHPRDLIKDNETNYVLAEILKVVLLRPLLLMMFCYDRTELPSISIFMPLKLLAWSLVLDMWFYSYHRLMHEVPLLWRFHRKHHTTRYPNSLLSAYADFWQELIDAYGVPFLTYMVLGRWYSFTEVFICSMAIILAESGGHSGARIYAQSMMNGWLLQPFGLELSLEDHDLHHRVGYRHLGKNLGKQCRLYDVMFGTSRPREESADQYVVRSWHANLRPGDGTIVGN